MDERKALAGILGVPLDIETSTIRTLAISVLLRAIADAGKRIRPDERQAGANLDRDADTAIHFLFGVDDACQGWCDIAEVTPDTMRDRLLHAPHGKRVAESQRATAEVTGQSIVNLRIRHGYWLEWLKAGERFDWNDVRNGLR